MLLFLELRRAAGTAIPTEMAIVATVATPTIAINLLLRLRSDSMVEIGNNGCWGS